MSSQQNQPWRTDAPTAVGLRLVAEFLAELQDALGVLVDGLIDAGVLEEEQASEPSSTPPPEKRQTT